MQQTRHRSALGASPIRPSIGTPLQRGGVTVPLHGINSRVQDTAYLLSHYARGVQGLSGINSRVQDTAYLLSHFSQGAPAAAPRSRSSSGTLDAAARAGMAGAATAAVSHGLGIVGASWLTQGVVLAATAEFIRKAFEEPKTELEKEAELVEAARKINNPFESAGVAGPDRYVVVQSPLRGMGSTGTMAGSLSAATTITAAALKSGTSLASSSTWLAAAGGPIGIGVAGVTVALSYLLSRQRPARKVATTQIVDEVEPLLQKNLADYMNGPRTVSSQTQALANFDAGWQFVVDNCGIPEMGEPGKWCVNDRKRGGQWDWFARYRDPIANDSTVVTDPPPDITTAIDPVTGERIYQESPGSLSNMMPLILALGMAAVALSFGGKK